MVYPCKSFLGLGVIAVACLTAQAAQAHAVAGDRVFVNTLLIDDPGVGDEANLPIYSVTSPDGKSTVTDLNVEYDKTITSSFGVGAGTDYDWITNDLMDNKKTHGGFDDPYVQLKYRWLLMPEHELISSVAVQQNFGRAGTTGVDPAMIPPSYRAISAKAWATFRSTRSAPSPSPASYPIISPIPAMPQAMVGSTIGRAA